MNALELLRCPACSGRLERAGAGLACRVCAKSFPVLAGIPCLLPDPAAAILDWRAGLHDLGVKVCDGRDRLLADMTKSSILPSTRRRLERLREGLGEQLVQIEALFAAAGLEPRPRSTERERLVPGDGPLAYFHQIHRDWGWSQEENEQAFDAIRALVPADRPLGKVLVLGAGAARLVRELHTRLGATVTIGLDLNPLPYFVARRILDGSPVELTEIPTSPRTSSDVAVRRTLGEGLEPVAGIDLVFGDALAPPVARDAFDTVISPWFVDQIAPDAAKLVPLVRSLLTSSGVWINHGPFIYPSSRPMHARYTEEELCELARAGGFEVVASQMGRATFMESPACNQGRTERVLTFVARRSERAPDIDAPWAPPWLDDTSVAVPLLDVFTSYVAPHPFFGAVVARVDGARSINRIAEEIATEQGLPLDAIRTAVQACLGDIAKTSR